MDVLTLRRTLPTESGATSDRMGSGVTHRREGPAGVTSCARQSPHGRPGHVWRGGARSGSFLVRGGLTNPHSTSGQATA